MQSMDIAIIGGGLAGSTAAAMLGRAGVSAVLVDPHAEFPADFRCEKLDSSQVELLRRTGLADHILPHTTLDRDVCIARFGRLIDRRPGDQRGIHYQDLVNTMRRAVPASVLIVPAKATHIATSDSHQRVTLSNGETISARLIVLANGLNVSLRHTLGLERTVTSACHSITIGFDMEPLGRSAFDFGALTYYPEHASHRMAYLTLFPIGATMRANLMVYRSPDDPWLREMRRDPVGAMLDLMPNLRRVTGEFGVTGPVKVRPADLYVTTGHRQAGVVLIGDAFATSCPAAGTGTSKVFTDVERLCNAHIPGWLETPGMNAAKIAAFYEDPVKQRSDAASAEKAYSLRSMSIDQGFVWDMRRWSRFISRAGAGALRQARETLVTKPASRQTHSV